MTVYDYRCDIGHDTVRYFPIAKEPVVVPCGWKDSAGCATSGCDRPATRVISASAIKVEGGTGANYQRRD